MVQPGSWKTVHATIILINGNCIIIQTISHTLSNVQYFFICNLDREFEQKNKENEDTNGTSRPTYLSCLIQLAAIG